MTMEFENYLANQSIPRLHIGGGNRLLDGWLNSDLAPPLADVIVLDATKIYPFKDATFNYIFSEHMIEHVPYASGSSMLKECFRVLKPGGKIRISTPDLRFLIDLYNSGDRRSAIQNEYLQWATNSFIHSAPFYDPVFVINNFMRDWGHLFIYDEVILKHNLRQAGFADITRRELNSSQDELLCNLESEHRLPPGFLRLETMTLEGTKPAC